jgi:hypothetical protein
MSHDLQAELLEGEIVVTMPGTSFMVAYQQCFEAPGLVAKSGFRQDKGAPITLNEFLIRAWNLANDKARDAGWMV